MRVEIVAVGKIKGRALRTVLDDYLGRIRRYAKLTEVEVRDGDASAVADKLARATEGPRDLVALEVEGTALSSEDLAARFERNRLRSISPITFVIGGSYGLPPTVAQRADLSLSLSRMTLPHRLARVVLAEQIYRAFTIVRGEPYNH